MTIGISKSSQAQFIDKSFPEDWASSSSSSSSNNQSPNETPPPTVAPNSSTPNGTPSPVADEQTETMCPGCQKGKGVTLPPIDLIAQPLPEIQAAIHNPQIDTRCFGNDPQGLVGGFEEILARAKRAGRHCTTELRRIACQESPWKELTLHQRMERLLALGKPYANQYGIDVRAMACTAGIETTDLNPLAKYPGSCRQRSVSSAQGLGQMTFSTLKDYVRTGGKRLAPFRSQIPPFNSPPYNLGTSDSAEKLFSAMANSVPLQLEIMAYTLKEKRNIGGSSDRNMFLRYHGLSRPYSRAASKCLECMRQRSDTNGRGVSGQGNPLHCLSLTVPQGRKGYYKSANEQIERSFRRYNARCDRLNSGGYSPLCSN